jgi:hypothetical protein
MKRWSHLFWALLSLTSGACGLRGYNCELVFLDTRSGTERLLIRHWHRGLELMYSAQMAISPTGTFLVASQDPRAPIRLSDIFVYDLQAGKILEFPHYQRDGLYDVEAFAFSPDGKHLLTVTTKCCSRMCFLNLFEFPLLALQARYLLSMQQDSIHPARLLFFPDGQRVLWSYRTEDSYWIEVWDLSGKLRHSAAFPLREVEREPSFWLTYDVALHPDGKTIAVSAARSSDQPIQTQRWARIWLFDISQQWDLTPEKARHVLKDPSNDLGATIFFLLMVSIWWTPVRGSGTGLENSGYYRGGIL